MSFIHLHLLGISVVHKASRFSYFLSTLSRFSLLFNTYSNREFLIRQLQVKMLLNILASFLLLGSAVAATCNGHSELCSRKYSNVTQIGAHDSAFVGILPTDNQFLSVTSQLDGGIRYLQAQSHLKNGVLQLCHTSCDLKDAGTFVEYLTTIKTWMDKNPNEVVTVLVTNGDGAPVSQFGTDMTTSGLASYAYSPGKQLAIADWPTLQELIDAKTRLVMFLGTFNTPWRRKRTDIS